MLFALVIAREIGADDLPVHAAVSSLEEYLGGEIERVWIMRREDDRLRPLEAVFLVYRA